MKNLPGVIACDTVTLMVAVDCGNNGGVYSLGTIGSVGNYNIYIMYTNTWIAHIQLYSQKAKIFSFELVLLHHSPILP